jgi:hypothetical protein
LKKNLFFIILLAALLPWVVLFGAGYLCVRLGLLVMIWRQWNRRGKNILLVYSSSHTWKAYFEERILPRVKEQAVVLNWSERSAWPKGFSLPVAAFRHFGGAREFNPLAVVFRPFHRTRIFRFWQPFKSQKHGRPQPLQKMEMDFLAAAGISQPADMDKR